MRHALVSAALLLFLLVATRSATAQEGGLGLGQTGGPSTPQGMIGTGGRGTDHLATSQISSVRLGATQLTGRGITRARVRRLLTQNLGRARRCYEAELARRADLAGEVSTSFVIAGGGRVTQAIGGELLGNRYVGACLSSVLRSLVFEGPRTGEVAVTQVFVFANRAE